MQLEVRHLKLVVAVAEEGTVTKAASRLHLTQSALSHQLRDVEERLGAALFLRISRKMILTPAGEKLLGSARSLLQALEQAEQDIRLLSTEQQGVIRLSTECYTCYHWLPPLLKQFQQTYPHVEVLIDVESTRKPIAALLSGKIDVAIAADTVKNRMVKTRKLFRDELVAIVAPDHRLATKTVLKAPDFADEHLIMYALHKEESTLFQRVLFPAGVMPRRVSPVQLTEAVIEMVKAGLGISVMARWAVEPYLAKGDLIGLRVTSKGILRDWFAATLAGNQPPKYLTEFVKLLGENPPGTALAHQVMAPEQ